MIRRERDDNARRVAQLEQRVEKRAEVAVESEDLIVNLARVGAERVADGIGRRERDRRGDPSGDRVPGCKASTPGERRLERDLVHHRVRRQRSRGGFGIASGMDEERR